METGIHLNDRLAIDTTGSLNNLVQYCERESMLYSIESRLPYLDYRLVEFLAKVPACYKIHDGWTKYLSRLAFDGKLRPFAGAKTRKDGPSLKNIGLRGL